MATARKTILVVDDEAGIRRVLKLCLTAAGYVVHESASGRQAIEVVSAVNPDTIVLDLGLPDIEGSEVVLRVRETNQCPILIVSVRGQESDKVSALDAGADDYLTKPFGNQELLARVRALLRRSGARELTRKLQCGSLTIDAARHQIDLAGKAVRLTATGYALLQALALRQGNVVTHRQLIREVWGGLCNDNALHVLHVTISNLRRKIEPNPLRPEHILTEPGIGYRLAAQTHVSKKAP